MLVNSIMLDSDDILKCLSLETIMNLIPLQNVSSTKLTFCEIFYLVEFNTDIIAKRTQNYICTFLNSFSAQMKFQLYISSEKCRN